MLKTVFLHPDLQIEIVVQEKHRKEARIQIQKTYKYVDLSTFRYWCTRANTPKKTTCGVSVVLNKENEYNGEVNSR